MIPKHSDAVNSSLPWVFGLRERERSENAHRISHYRTLAFALLGRFPDVTKGEKTTIAEKGLGIEPSFYWYIARIEQAFGHIISFWYAVSDEWEENEMGISPFDSGGIYHGHIKTNPDFDDDQKNDFFRGKQCCLKQWDETVGLYLVENYDSRAEYVLGKSPKIGIPEILKLEPNTSQAWTWEARVRTNSVNQCVRIDCVYFPSSEKISFFTWLAGFDPVDQNINEWLNENERKCLVTWLKAAENCRTTKAISAYGIAQKALMSLIGLQENAQKQ